MVFLLDLRALSIPLYGCSLMKVDGSISRVDLRQEKLHGRDDGAWAVRLEYDNNKMKKVKKLNDS
jgi:hypothetical protein